MNLSTPVRPLNFVNIHLLIIFSYKIYYKSIECRFTELSLTLPETSRVKMLKVKNVYTLQAILKFLHVGSGTERKTKTYIYKVLKFGKRTDPRHW